MILQSSKGTFSTCTFKLKRTRPKEPLGLVLVSGDKVNCYAKLVEFLLKLALIFELSCYYNPVYRLLKVDQEVSM